MYNALKLDVFAKDDDSGGVNLGDKVQVKMTWNMRTKYEHCSLDRSSY